jgi:hypothetical protein
MPGSKLGSPWWHGRPAPYSVFRYAAPARNPTGHIERSARLRGLPGYDPRLAPSRRLAMAPLVEPRWTHSRVLRARGIGAGGKRRPMVNRAGGTPLRCSPPQENGVLSTARAQKNMPSRGHTAEVFAYSCARIAEIENDILFMGVSPRATGQGASPQAPGTDAKRAAFSRTRDRS